MFLNIIAEIKKSFIITLFNKHVNFIKILLLIEELNYYSIVLRIGWQNLYLSHWWKWINI